MSQLTDDLTAARDRLAQGWCKNKLADGPNVCAVGAIRTVITGSAFTKWITSEGWYDRCNAATEAVVDHLPGDGFGGWLPDYNDHQFTTHEDILMLFDKTIADLGGM